MNGMNASQGFDLLPGPDPGACPGCGQWLKAGLLHDCPHDDWLRPVLGHCPHGVDLDREFCPKGCRV